ncbi:MAG: GntR family transcriptional regulator [Gammaproteobacteria bacterium]|nr:GntR family transcriptional regulator [Gammaproteobacteria bacterium]
MNTDRISLLFEEYGADPNLSMPKYLRVCDVILKLIENHELKTGERLPTESDLTAALPVSLGTVQKALGILTDRGVLKRVQGSGTYVAENNTELSDLWHFRFIGGDGQKVLPVFIKVLSVDRVRDPGPWATFLGKDSYFVRISREVDVNHEFRGVGQFFLRGSDFGSLMEYDLNEFEGVHLRSIIQQRFRKSTTRVIERVAAETFPDAICRWLEVPFYSQGLVCQILGYTYNDKPLSFQQLFVPPNVRPLEIREHKPKSPG